MPRLLCHLPGQWRWCCYCCWRLNTFLPKMCTSARSPPALTAQRGGQAGSAERGKGCSSALLCSGLRGEQPSGKWVLLPCSPCQTSLVSLYLSYLQREEFACAMLLPASSQSFIQPCHLCCSIFSCGWRPEYLLVNSCSDLGRSWFFFFFEVHWVRKIYSNNYWAQIQTKCVIPTYTSEAFHWQNVIFHFCLMINLVWRAGENKPFVISVLCFRLGLYVLHVGTRCRELPIWVKWPLARRCLTTAFLGCGCAATPCCTPLLSTAPGAQLYTCLNALPPQEQLQIHSETWKWSHVWSSSSTVRKCFCRGNFDSFL